MFILVAVKGRVQGNTVFIDEDIRAYEGAEVIVTLLNCHHNVERKTVVDGDGFVIPSKWGQNVDEYIKEVR